MIQRETKLCELLSLTTGPILRAIRIKLLLREIRYEATSERYCHDMAQAYRAAARLSQTDLIHLRAELRDMGGKEPEARPSLFARLRIAVRGA